MTTERCRCAECLDLDALPERLQGVPGSFQLKLFPAKKRRKRKNVNSNT